MLGKGRLVGNFEALKSVFMGFFDILMLQSLKLQFSNFLKLAKIDFT